VFVPQLPVHVHPAGNGAADALCTKQELMMRATGDKTSFMFFMFSPGTG
jgi:hypothetical protein